MPSKRRVKQPVPHELTLTLWQNGVDFMRVGIESFFSKDSPRPRDYKYSILHVFAGVLLLLKEKLHRIDPSLVFSREGKTDPLKDHTVDLPMAIDRLQGRGVTLRDEQRTLLYKAKRTRNRIEHLQCQIKLVDAIEIVGGLCEFAHEFMDRELQVSLQSQLRPKVWRRVKELEGIAASRFEKRKKAWEVRAKAFKELDDDELAALLETAVEEPDDCPKCHQLTLMLEGDTAVCTRPSCRAVLMAWPCVACERYVVKEGETWCQTCIDTAEYYDLVAQGRAPAVENVIRR